MASKQKKGTNSSLINLVLLAISFFNVTYKAAKLIKAEVHLAVESLIALIIFSVISGILLVTVWLGLMGLLFLYFLSLHWSEMLSISIIIAVNLGLILVLAIFMRKAKKHLFFPCSRKQLQLLRKLVDDEY